MDIRKLIDIICNILLVLIVFSLVFFIIIKNTLINPNTMDIKIISFLVLLFIVGNILKFLLKDNR